MKRSTLALFAVLVLPQLALTPAVFAKGRHGNGHHGGGGGMFPPGVMEKLNLTAEQKEKIRAIRQEAKSESTGGHAEMKKSHEQFRAKMAGNASDDELKSEFAKMQEQRAEFAKKRFERMLKVRAVLTPDQRQQFTKLVEQRRSKHRGHADDQDE